MSRASRRSRSWAPIPGRSARDAGEAVRDIQARGKIPMIVGGSGLYLRALLEGLFEGPERNDAVRERLEARIANEGLGALRADLARVDPQSHTKILPGDAVRVIRALEVYEITGKPISTLR